jgi:hypothetical protein
VIVVLAIPDLFENEYIEQTAAKPLLIRMTPSGWQDEKEIGL